MVILIIRMFFKSEKLLRRRFEVVCLFFGLGILYSFGTYQSLNDFLDDMHSELIGMCLEVGLIYFFIDASLENERKREEREKEKRLYQFILKDPLDSLLKKLESRYISLFDTSLMSFSEMRLSEEFFEKPKEIRWNLFRSDQRKSNSYEYEYKDYFQNYAEKEIRNFLNSYQNILPQHLVLDLLYLERVIKETWIALGSKETLALHINLIGLIIFRIKEYTEYLDKEWQKGMNELIHRRRQMITRQKRWKQRYGKIKQFFTRSQNKDKDNGISTDA
mgnify:CR=1 FL=1